MEREFIEVNIDGLIGPTHHFGGLGVENKASEMNRSQFSSPRKAAMQGLDKMELVASYGIPQFYLPPPCRPAWAWLESLGFVGDNREVLEQCANRNATVLSAAYSSAFMWTANAASVSCGSDTTSGQSIIKLANLNANLHRSIEGSERYPQFKRMFESVELVKVLKAIDSSRPLSDEGAANVMRFCDASGVRGVYALVFGEDSESQQQSVIGNDGSVGTGVRKRRQPRQTRLASGMVANALELSDTDFFLVQQSREAIDAGVFHNDVIATSHENLLLFHEKAFQHSEEVVGNLKRRFSEKTGKALDSIMIEESELTLDDAVDTYLFNSQICTDSHGALRMFVPDNCKQSSSVEAILNRLRAEIPRIRSVDYCSLGESMRNGGGPACLRLRISLSPSQIAKMPEAMRISSATLKSLRKVVESEYPEKIDQSDFANPAFAEHCERVSLQIASLWGANSTDSR